MIHLGETVAVFYEDSLHIGCVLAMRLGNTYLVGCIASERMGSLVDVLVDDVWVKLEDLIDPSAL